MVSSAFIIGKAKNIAQCGQVPGTKFQFSEISITFINNRDCYYSNGPVAQLGYSKLVFDRFWPERAIAFYWTK